MVDYDAGSNTSSLAAVLVSRSNAVQRRGRAGRIQSGFCYHLFSRYVYDHVMTEYPVPEMLRMRLEHIILHVKLLGLGPVSEFLGSCISPPDPVAVERTLHFLREIQALDLCKTPALSPWAQQMHTNFRSKSRQQLREAARKMKQAYNSTGDLPSNEDRLTKESYSELPGDRAELSSLGVHLAQLPLDPQLAKMLIFGALFGCLEPALAVAACLNYRDPFEIPLDKQVPVMKMRQELSQNTLSDHWIYVNVLQKYRKFTNPFERRKFCQTYLLRENVLRDILSLMKDYASLLHERRYIDSPDPFNRAANINKDNFPLFRAILCGSLFPNIIKLAPKEKNGAIQRPRIIARPMEGKVNISNFSINENVRLADSAWAVYFQKTKVEGSTPFVLDTTIVPLRPVLLFSGILQDDPLDPSLFTIDKWIKVRADQKLFNVVKGLRECLEDLLESKYRKPSPIVWDPSSAEGMLLQTIVDLLVSESVSTSQTGRNYHAGSHSYEPDVKHL